MSRSQAPLSLLGTTQEPSPTTRPEGRHQETPIKAALTETPVKTDALPSARHVMPADPKRDELAETTILTKQLEETNCPFSWFPTQYAPTARESRTHIKESDP